MRAAPKHLPDQPMQRVVPANGSTPPTTSAASSVFGAGFKPPGERRRAPRRALPTFDPLAVVIDKGVPIPPKTAGRGYKGPCLALLERVKVGESVELSSEYEKTMRSAIKRQKRVIPGAEYTVRCNGDRMRVWRTA